jgi:hypothetical protein
VAKAFGTKPEVYRRLSWKALHDPSSPSLLPAVRQDLEARVISGELITGPDIRRAGRSPAGTVWATKRAANGDDGGVIC